MRVVKVILLFLSLSLTSILFCQGSHQATHQKEVLRLDSILFDVGFNQCMVEETAKIISEDFEFYHDQGGITKGKEDFLNSIKNNICALSYRPFRKLLGESTETFPLYNNGVFYGVIQRGIHEFYADEEGKERYLTSTARFTHLWLLEDDQLRLRRVLSFDHHSPE